MQCERVTGLFLLRLTSTVNSVFLLIIFICISLFLYLQVLVVRKYVFCSKIRMRKVYEIFRGFIYTSGSS